MFKKLSIQWKLSIVSAILLTTCCIGLTMILNFSAYRMVDSVEILPITTPAITTPNVACEEALTLSPLLPAAQVSKIKQTFSLQSVLSMLTAILGGSALTYYFVGKALQPLQSLHAQVKNMTVQNLSEELPIPIAKDEIAELTASFNEMTDKLNEAFLIQKRFSASATHELRTPLAVLQAKIDVFKKVNSHEVVDYKALVSVFEQQMKRLRNLVDSLLAMTNMDDYEEWCNIDLQDVFEDILSELSPIAKEKHIRLLYEGENCFVSGNLDLLYRAFYNLIENGIKYNRENGTVSVTVKKGVANTTEIIICDTGIGIPDDMKKHIFEPFFRVDKSRSRAMGGAGLGLSIVDSIIRKHHGTIAVSDNPTGGTCFCIQL